MAITNIYTNLSDAALGNPTVSDSIAMLICPATATTGGTVNFTLDTAVQITSLRELGVMGITEANNPQLYFNVEEFFEQAGSGSKLWIIGYSGDPATYLAGTDLEDEIISTGIALFDDRPRFIGFVVDPTALPTDLSAEAEGVPALIQTCIRNMQTLLDNLFEEESMRMCGVIDCAKLHVVPNIQDGPITAFLDCASLNAPKIALQITTSTIGQTASIGQTLGRMAAISIQTSIGTHALAGIDTIGYFLDAIDDGTVQYTPVTALKRAKYTSLGQKQYLFTRKYPQEVGIFYNDGATCNDATMALSSLEFNRVGNAICDSVEAFFVKMINTEVETTTSGEISPGYKSTQLADLDARFLQPRINRGEAQQVDVDFWAKDSNFIRSRAVEVVVRIFPNASLREVFIEVTFVSSLE